MGKSQAKNLKNSQIPDALSWAYSPGDEDKFVSTNHPL